MLLYCVSQLHGIRRNQSLLHLHGVWLSTAAVWQVHLLARGEKLRASRAMQDRVLNHKKVTVHFNTMVDDAYPDGKGALAGLHTKDTKSGQDFLCACTPHMPSTPTAFTLTIRQTYLLHHVTYMPVTHIHRI